MNSTTNLQTHRIGYIDTMRGLAMFLVVIGHVYVKSFDCGSEYYDLLCWQIEIPLFFFISGFFAQRLMKKSFSEVLKEKTARLLIPAFIMLALYCACFNLNYVGALFKNMKDGYWFTFSLFEYIIIFFSCEKLFALTKCSKRTTTALHLLVALVICYVGAYFRNHMTNPITSLFILPELINYPFFLFGSLVYSHRERLTNKLYTNYLWGGVLILVYLAGEIVLHNLGFESLGLASTLLYQFLVLAAVCIIWYCFENSYDSIQDCQTMRFLSLIGRRSLDVYFLHYFFLPANLRFVGDFFKTIDAPFIEFVLALMIALCLCAASLIAGAIIRQFPLAANFMLGTNRYTL